MSPAEIDIVLKADSEDGAARAVGGRAHAQVIHDCFYSDGRRVSMAPRHVLRNIVELYAQRGWEPIVAPELESISSSRTRMPTIRSSPRGPFRALRARPPVPTAIAAVNEFDPLFDDIYQFCEDQDIEIDTLIHEDGPAQMEINLIHGQPLDLADQVFLFKRNGARGGPAPQDVLHLHGEAARQGTRQWPCTSTRACWDVKTRKKSLSG